MANRHIPAIPQTVSMVLLRPEATGAPFTNLLAGPFPCRGREWWLTLLDFCFKGASTIQTLQGNLKTEDSSNVSESVRAIGNNSATVVVGYIIDSAVLIFGAAIELRELVMLELCASHAAPLLVVLRMPPDSVTQSVKRSTAIALLSVAGSGFCMHHPCSCLLVLHVPLATDLKSVGIQNHPPSFPRLALLACY